MKSKKMLAALILALVLLLAACSGGNTGSGTQSDQQSGGSQPAGTGGGTEQVQNIELRMAWWGDDDRHQRTQQAIELFEQKNPHIKITPEPSGFDGYFDKLNTQIAAGNAPDLIQMGGNIKEYVDKNALLNLSPYMGKELDLSDFNQALVKEATFDGNLYGVTLGVSAFSIMYNANLFNEAGVALPAGDWTFDDMAKTIIELKQKLGDGYYGSYDLSDDASTLGAFLGAHGAELYRDGERHFEREDMVNWFQYWKDLRDQGAIVPMDVQVSNPDSAADQSLVVKGQVAIQSAAGSQIFGYQALTEDTLGLTVYPAGPAGSGMIPPISGQFITAYAQTDHPEAVAAFISFMVNDPEAGVILGNSRGVPPAGVVRDALAAQASPVDAVLYDYISLVSDVAPPVEYQQFPLDNEFIKLLQLVAEKIAFNAASVDDAVDEFMTEIDKLLEKAKAE